MHEIFDFVDLFVPIIGQSHLRPLVSDGFRLILCR
jgi:hypothetical protein